MEKIKFLQKGDTIRGDKYKKEGLEAQKHKEEKAIKEENERYKYRELRPIIIKKADPIEKMMEKRDSIRYMPQVIGMSGADPIGEFIVGSIATGGLLKGASWLGKQAIDQGKKIILAKAIDRTVSKGVQDQQRLFPGLIGWGPKQTFRGYHASDSPTFNPNFFFNGWAQKTHNAPYGIYVAKGTQPEGGFLAKRPYVHQVEVNFDKPQVQIGEVKGLSKNGIRNQIERDAQAQGADGIIYQDIADNQLQHQTIAKTLNPNVKVNGIIKESKETDDLLEYIARQKQYVEQMRKNGTPLPPGFLEKLRELEQNVYAKQMDEMNIGPVIATENLPGILGPMYDDLAKGSYTVLHSGPYIETTVGSKNIIPIGVIKPGSYTQYRANRIIRGLQQRGVDVDQIGFYPGRGQKVIGSPRKLAQDIPNQPATLYITRKPNGTAGFYHPSSGRANVKIKPNSKPSDIRSTEVHENFSHPTDDFIEAFPNTTNNYKNLASSIEKFGTISKDSSKWWEVRSTIMEVHKKIADEIRKPIRGSYEEVDDYVNKAINNMSYQELAQNFREIGGYGVDYANYIMAHPFEVNRFKDLLKYGLSWGTPIGIGTMIGYGKSE